MKIELGATDELSQPDGKARNIIALIDGKQLILPVDKTIYGLLELSEKIAQRPPAPPLQSKASIRQETFDKEVVESIMPPEDSLEIQVGDIVIYEPKSAGGYTPTERCEQMDGRVRIAAQYRVLALPDDPAIIDIIDDSAPSPTRVTIPKFDVVLHKKTHKIRVQVKHQYEQIIECPSGCKESSSKGTIMGPSMVVLIREENQDQYEGKCVVCQQTFTAPYPTPEKSK